MLRAAGAASAVELLDRASLREAEKNADLLALAPDVHGALAASLLGARRAARFILFFSLLLFSYCFLLCCMASNVFAGVQRVAHACTLLSSERKGAAFPAPCESGRWPWAKLRSGRMLAIWSAEASW